MAGVLTLHVTGDVHVAGRLRDLAQRGRDPRPVWGVLHDRFIAMEVAQFATEGHGSWPALAPSTVRSKPPGMPMMRRSDRLYGSLTQGPAVNEQGGHILRLGTDDPVAGYHQRAKRAVVTVTRSTRRRGGLPQRKVIQFTPAERAAWVRIMRHYVTTGRLDSR